MRVFHQMAHVKLAFHEFKDGYFNVNGKVHEGALKKFEDRIVEFAQRKSNSHTLGFVNCLEC